MTLSREYLNKLPNVRSIEALARQMLELELQMDHKEQSREEIRNKILILENELKIFKESDADAADAKKVREGLDGLSKMLMGLNAEIVVIQKNISHLQDNIGEGIRKGLKDLFQEAKMKHDRTEKDLIRHRELAEKAHEKLEQESASSDQVNRALWVRNMEKVIAEEEKLAKYERELESIKRVYKQEFG